jgi:DNA polymerase delta subunit 1
MADRPGGQVKRPPGGQGDGPAPKRPSYNANGPDEDEFLDEDPIFDQDFDDCLGGPPEPSEEPELGEAGRNWERPPVEPFNPASTSLGA